MELRKLADRVCRATGCEHPPIVEEFLIEMKRQPGFHQINRETGVQMTNFHRIEYHVADMEETIAQFKAPVYRYDDISPVDGVIGRFHRAWCELTGKPKAKCYGGFLVGIKRCLSDESRTFSRCTRTIEMKHFNYSSRYGFRIHAALAYDPLSDILFFQRLDVQSTPSDLLWAGPRY